MSSTTCRCGAIYSLPFGHGQKWANHGIADEIIGGFQLNGQYSYLGGQPFSVSANSNLIGNVTPGWGTTYAQLIAPYKKLGGHDVPRRDRPRRY